MNDGRSQTEQIDAWLEEGLRFYSQGDPSRALEAWYRILDVDAGHARAQQYVAYVRQVYRLDTVANGTGPAEEAPPPEPAPAISPAISAISQVPEATTTDTKKLLGYDAGSSWSDLVESSFDVTVPPESTPSKPTPRAPAAAPKIAANPWAVPARTKVDAPPKVSTATGTTTTTTTMPPPPEASVEAKGDPWSTSNASISSPGQVMPAPAMPAEPPAPPPLEAPLELPIEMMDVPTAGTEEPLTLSQAADELAAGFDPWRGDTIPPMAPPAEWAATAQETFDIPPTPPPLTAEQIAAAMDPPEPAIEIDLDAGDAPVVGVQIEDAVMDLQVEVDMTAEPEVTAPVPAWQPTARPGSDLGPQVRSVGGSRVDVLPGRPPAPPLDRTAAWPARFEERVIKQSVRFGDEPAPAKAPPPIPVEAHGTVMDPWDEVGGPGASLDLDRPPPPGAVVGSPLDVFGHERTPGGFSTASLDSVTSAAPEDECTALMRGARELFELGDFSGSLDLVEKVLKLEPNHEGARAYLQRNESTLIRMYESKLGNMRKTPKPLMPPDEVIWMNMHHKAGFLLSQVDGMLTYEDLLEVSGMPRFDTMRILHELVQQGIIG